MPYPQSLIHFFGRGFKVNDLDPSSVLLLGGKGYHLARMTQLGLNVPPGVTITTEGRNVSQDVLKVAVDEAMNQLYSPDSLYSVRSGAPVSMPGMMDTVLNVGIFKSNFSNFSAKLGEKTAIDCYTRFLEMYATIVKGVPGNEFNAASSIDEYESVYEKLGIPIPNELTPTLLECVKAVYSSWDSERAIAYRKTHNVPDTGTAVNIQKMVFGNLNDNSATGVLFSRDPSTGENNIVGEFLINAQGEDVVAGIRTPKPLQDMEEWNPGVYKELVSLAKHLENKNRDAQDIEFTIEDGEVFILQTRNMKRTSRAAFRVAYDLVKESKISKEEAISRVSYEDFLNVSIPSISPDAPEPDYMGIPASPGIAKGVVIQSYKEANSSKESCILVAEETNPEDYPCMELSAGILTEVGGHTSHAAVVARGMNKPAVVGVGKLNLNPGDFVTLDGSTGRVWKGDIPVLSGEMEGFVSSVLLWAIEEKVEGVIPEITLHIPTKQPELFEAAINSLPDEGRISINVSGVTTTSVKGLNKIMLGMKSKKKLSGIINLVSRGLEVDDEDKEFLKILGLNENPEVVNDTILRRHIKDLLHKKWTDEFQNKWRINVPTSDEYLHYMEDLQERGWSLLSDIDPEKLKALDALGLTQEEFFKAMKFLGKSIDLNVKIVDIRKLAFEVLN